MLVRSNQDKLAEKQSMSENSADLVHVGDWGTFGGEPFEVMHM